MMTTAHVLFRKELSLEKMDGINTEFDICSKYLQTSTERTSIPDGSLVFGRYSVLPYYRELERDLKNRNCTLVNSAYEHNWIAGFQWYNDCEFLQQFTPRTWEEWRVPYMKYDGPYVVKGCTNSKKHQWDTHMFAACKRDLLEVTRNLHIDSLVGNQTLLVREYVPLKTFEVGIHGLPFTNEWRFFFYKETMLSYGYYWSNLDDMSKPYITEEAIEFAKMLAREISKYTNFFVLDIAEREEGGWIMIEINDGQMSGLSMNDPEVLYKNLAEIV